MFRIWKALVLLLVFEELFLKGLGDRPSPTSIKILKKEGGYLQSDVKIFDISLQFDQDLYLLRTKNNCGSLPKSCQVITSSDGCGACNYASQNECGAKDLPQNNKCDSCSSKTNLCSSDNSWIELETPSQNKPTITISGEFLANGDQKEYRFQISEAQACSVFRVSLNVYWGDPDFTWESVEDSYYGEFASDDGSDAVRCPLTSTDQFLPGTQRLIVTPFNSDAFYNITIAYEGEMTSEQALPSTESVSLCSPSNQTDCLQHNILENDFRYSFESDPNERMDFVIFFDKSRANSSLESEWCIPFSFSVWGDVYAFTRVNDIIPSYYDVVQVQEASKDWDMGTWVSGYGESSFVHCFTPSEEEEGDETSKGNGPFVVLSVFNLENVYELTVTQNTDRMQIFPLASFQPFDVVRRLSGNTYIHCEIPPMEGLIRNSIHAKNFARLVTSYSVFINEIAPYEENYIWPPFLWFKAYLPSTLEMLRNNGTDPLNSKKIAFQYLYSSITRNDLYPENYFRDHEISTNCTFTLYGRIVNQDFQPVFVPEEQSHFGTDREDDTFGCDVGKLSLLIETVNQLFVDLDKYFDSPHLISTRFLIDRNVFSDTWQQCQNSLTHSYDVVETTTELMTKDCDLSQAEGKSDPCCYLADNWRGCCSEHTIPLPSRNFSLNVPKFKQKICPAVSSSDQDCASTFLEDYSSFLSLEATTQPGRCLSTVDQDTAFQWQYMRPWVNCMNSIFGTTLQGIQCDVDSDCPSGSGWICNTITHLCSHPDPDGLFSECFLENMHPYILNFLEKSKQTHFSDSTALRQSYSANDCFFSGDDSESSRWTQMHSRYSYELFGECSNPNICDDPRSLSTFADVPLPCSLSVCNRIWKYHESSKTQCEEDYFCNYDQQLTSRESCLPLPSSDEEFFCGYCPEDSDQCTEIIGISSEEDCTSVCLLANGALQQLSAEECANQKSCTKKCLSFNAPVDCSETQCNGYGVCTDREYKTGTSFRSPFFFGCVFNSSDWYDFIGSADELVQICDTQNSFHVIGGLCYSNDPTSRCSDVQYIAGTEEQCVQPKACSRTLYYPGKVSQTDLLPDFDGCHECGTEESVFSWTPAEWRGGEMKPGRWMRRNWVSNSVYRPGLAYKELGDDVLDAISALYSFQLKTEVRCRIGRLKGVLDTIYCLCDGTRDCTNSSFPVALSAACRGAPTRVQAEDTSLVFGTNAIDSGCSDLEAFALSRQLWKRGDQRPLFSSSFITYRRKVNDFEFTNRHDAVIGRILGDAMRFTSQSEVRNVTICFPLSDSATDGDFQIFDVASFDVDDVFSITILEAPVKLSGGRRCADLDNSHLSSVVRQQDGIFSYAVVPIIRKENYQESTDPSLDLSDGYIALLVIVALGYLFLAFYSIYVTIQIQPWVGALFSFANANAFLTCLLFIFGASRFVYLILLATRTITSGSNYADVFLFEAGTWIFITVFLFILLFWIFLIRMTSGAAQETSLNQFKLTYFFTVLALWLLFLSLVLVFIFANGSSEVQTSCFDRLFDDNTGWSQQDSVILGYRICLLVIALLTGLGFAIYGRKVFNLKKNTSKANSANQNQEQKIFFITSASALGFVTQSILLLVLSIIDPNSKTGMIALIFLLPCEVLPGFLTNYTLTPSRQEKEKKKTSSSGPSSSSNVTSSNAATSRFASSSVQSAAY